TDGEDTSGSDVLGAARGGASAGIRIYTIGIGSVGGSPIPAVGGQAGGYRKNAQGESVVSKLAAPVLERVAHLRGWRYYSIESGKSPLGAVLNAIATLEGKRQASSMQTIFDEQFPWLLLFSILLLALEPVLGLRTGTTKGWSGRFQ